MKKFVSILLAGLMAASNASAFYTSEFLLSMDFHKWDHTAMLSPIDTITRKPVVLSSKDFMRFHKDYKAYKSSKLSQLSFRSLLLGSCLGDREFICICAFGDIQACAYATARYICGGNIDDIEELSPFVSIISRRYCDNRRYPAYEINKICALLGLIFQEFSKDELEILIRTASFIDSSAKTEEEFDAKASKYPKEPLCRILWEKFFELESVASIYSRKFCEDYGELLGPR